MIVSRRPDIERFLDAPPAGMRAALIYGRDRGQVRERADRLARAATADPDDPFTTARLTDADIDRDPAALEGELVAQSLVGGRRLVRLRLSGDRAAAERAAADALKAHAEGGFNPDAFFLIEAGELRRDSPVRRNAERADACAVLPCYEDEPGDLARLIRESLAKDKLALAPDALELVVSRLPHERGVARQEIERLALFLGPGGGGGAATAEALAPFLGVEPEASLADAAQDAFGGKLAQAQAGLRRAAAVGEGGPAAVRALSFHAARLRRIVGRAAEGAGLVEAAKATGVFWRNEKEMVRQARAWSIEALDQLAPQLLDADRACKQTGSPDRLVAERLAMSIAGRARRLGL
jgi:DNA polymerase-3 subunit delta